MTDHGPVKAGQRSVKCSGVQAQLARGFRASSLLNTRSAIATEEASPPCPPSAVRRPPPLPLLPPRILSPPPLFVPFPQVPHDPAARLGFDVPALLRRRTGTKSEPTAPPLPFPYSKDRTLLPNEPRQHHLNRRRRRLHTRSPRRRLQQRRPPPDSGRPAVV